MDSWLVLPCQYVNNLSPFSAGYNHIQYNVFFVRLEIQNQMILFTSVLGKALLI
jgi:hypothetical protein